MILKQLLPIEKYPFKNILTDEIEIVGITSDSRHVRPGYAFFAFPGSTTDGHFFIEKAIQNGASVIIFSNPAFSFSADQKVSWIRVDDGRKALAWAAANFFGHPSQAMKLIGVTGTNGKTSTCFLLRNIFEENGNACGLMTTPKNVIGPDVYEAVNTTEESLEIQASLKGMIEKGIQQAILEVSSHGLALGRVESLFFDAAVVTNIIAEHLEFHKSFEHYFLSKKKLIEMVENNDKKNYPRVVVVNGDDENCQRIIRETHLPVLTFGFQTGNDILAEKVRYFLDKTQYRLKSPWGSCDILLPLPGHYNVYNAMAAATTALYYGIDRDCVVQALQTIHRIPGRWEVVEAGQDFTVIVDFAHNWHGLENTLSFLRKLAKKKIITVFGCGGERDRKKRPMMGETVARWSDICIVTSDNPRNEDPLQTAEDALEGVLRFKKNPPIQSCIILDRRDAIRKALFVAQPGDIVFLAGKGPERYQVYRDSVIQHNDYDVAKELLKERYQ